jgi:hypothetical protein
MILPDVEMRPALDHKHHNLWVVRIFLMSILDIYILQPLTSNDYYNKLIRDRRVVFCFAIGESGLTQTKPTYHTQNEG